jgi:hypothetical protein
VRSETKNMLPTRGEISILPFPLLSVGWSRDISCYGDNFHSISICDLGMFVLKCIRGRVVELAGKLVVLVEEKLVVLVEEKLEEKAVDILKKACGKLKGSVESSRFKSLSSLSVDSLRFRISLMRILALKFCRKIHSNLC